MIMVKITIYLQNNNISLTTKIEDYKKIYKDLFELFNATTLQIIKTKDRNIIIAPSNIQAIEFEKIDTNGEESTTIVCENIEVKKDIEEDIISD